MNFLNQYRGHLICAGLGILVGALLVLWLKKPSGQIVMQNPVVNTPAPVQPKFDKQRWIDSTLRADVFSWKQKDKFPSLPDSPKTSIPQVVQPEPATDTLCPPFTLKLVSDDSVPKQFGLDSVSLFYRWPPGDHFFAFWPRPTRPLGKESGGLLSTNHNMLAFGLSTAYLRYQNNLYANAYVRLRVKNLNLEIGYHHQTRQQLSWFVSVGKEWRVF